MPDLAAIRTLVNGGILSINEGRKLMGFPPLGGVSSACDTDLLTACRATIRAYDDGDDHALLEAIDAARAAVAKVEVRDNLDDPA